MQQVEGPAREPIQPGDDQRVTPAEVLEQARQGRPPDGGGAGSLLRPQLGDASLGEQAPLVDDLEGHTDRLQAEDESGEMDDADAPLARLERAETASGERQLPEHWRTETPVLCLPGPSLLDEAAALLVSDLLRRKSIGARAEAADALSMARIFALQTDGVALICLCYVECATPAQIHYALRRLRRRVPDVVVIVALFGNAEGPSQEDAPENTDFVQQSLREVVGKIEEVVHGPINPTASGTRTSESLAPAWEPAPKANVS